eukprot:scaffold2443_cov67-Phaeocystis_antarctica.AAC.3
MLTPQPGRRLGDHILMQPRGQTQPLYHIVLITAPVAIHHTPTQPPRTSRCAGPLWRCTCACTFHRGRYGYRYYESKDKPYQGDLNTSLEAGRPGYVAEDVWHCVGESAIVKGIWYWYGGPGVMTRHSRMQVRDQT